ncbi:MAG: hypothetical protein WAZ40_00420 [Minisyncoccia bacterium]
MEPNFENPNELRPTDDIIIEEVKDPENKHGRNHGGNGRQAGSELTMKVAEIKKLRERLQKDNDRLEKDKEAVRHEINEINTHLKKAIDEGDAKEIANWNTRLKNAENLIVFISPLSNEAILAELKNYRQTREQQIEANNRVNNYREDERELALYQRAKGDYTRAETEAHAIDEKIAGLMRERDQETLRAVSSPVRDEGVIYTHEQAIADEIAWKKRHQEMAEERSYKEAVTAELTAKREAEEKEHAQKISVADMNPAPIEGKIEVNEENRMKETLSVKEKLTERLEVIRENTDPDSILEKERIEMMLVSLNKDFKDSIKIEDSMVTTTETSIPSPVEIPTKQATADDWQEEAVKTFEEKGGTVPALEFLPDPEKDANLLPVPLEEKVSQSEIVLPPEEGKTEALAKIEALMGTLMPLESAPVLTDVEIINIAEANTQTRERALRKIQNAEQLLKEVETRAEKAGALDRVRAVGEWCGKVPTHYKLMLSMGLVASGAALSATSATVAIGVLGVGIRAVGGAMMFVAFEQMLKNDAEKKGVERTKSRELTDTALAATLAVVVTVLVPKIVQDSGIFSGFFDKISGFFGGHTTPLEVPVEKPVATVTSVPVEIYTEVAKEGDSIWKMAERQLVDHYGEKFTGLTPEKQTYFIDAIKDAVAENPANFGMTNADTLAVGQEIDFKEIFDNTELMERAFSGAQEFVPEVQPEILAETEIPKEPTLTELLRGETGETSSSKDIPIHDLITEGYPEQTIPVQDFITEGYPEQTPNTAPAPETITNPQSIIFANEQLQTIIKDVFGKKGWFLGFGSTDGMETFSQFANKSVETVLNTETRNFPQGDTQKVQQLIFSAQEQSKVLPKGGETIETYLKRAASITIDKFLKTGTIVK